MDEKKEQTPDDKKIIIVNTRTTPPSRKKALESQDKSEKKQRGNRIPFDAKEKYNLKDRTKSSCSAVMTYPDGRVEKRTF